MITYQIIVNSKNPKSLKLFFLFCCQNKKFNLKTTFYKNKNKKKYITVLKSPHVNKKAQTQFEYRIFSTKMIISSPNAIQYLVLLKKIKSRLFSEIKIKTKLIISKQNQFQLQTQLLKPKKFTLNNFNNYKIQSHKLTNPNDTKNLTYLKVFDCFGEVNLTKNIPYTKTYDV